MTALVLLPWKRQRRDVGVQRLLSPSARRVIPRSRSALDPRGPRPTSCSGSSSPPRGRYRFSILIASRPAWHRGCRRGRVPWRGIRACRTGASYRSSARCRPGTSNPPVRILPGALPARREAIRVDRREDPDHGIRRIRSLPSKRRSVAVQTARSDLGAAGSRPSDSAGVHRRGQQELLRRLRPGDGLLAAWTGEYRTNAFWVAGSASMPATHCITARSLKRVSSRRWPAGRSSGS
jgi:hypothetical protein